MLNVVAPIFPFQSTFHMAEKHLSEKCIWPNQAPSTSGWPVLKNIAAGNTKGGSITVLLTSCLTGLESAVWQLTIYVFICKTD